MASWNGFSKKSPQDRMDQIQKNEAISPQGLEALRKGDQLSLEVADQMVENLLGTFSLPFSLAPDFLIDDKLYQLPMVTEEPSVVLAASYAAKIIKRAGGFQTRIRERLMIGQIAFYDVAHPQTAIEKIEEKKELLLELAREAYPSIVKRGGGPRDLWAQEKGDFLVFYLSLDSQEAMGANMLNTILEALKTPLEELILAPSLMGILSNYATESLVEANCSLPISYLSRNKEEAHEIARKMDLASQLAQTDPYRAATHNKGIFNGIDALLIATGNDWRAIEAGAHAFASRDGHYKGLSQWVYHAEEGQLKGRILLPLPVASRGGSIGLNPGVAIARDLLQEPSARQLASCVAALGLAQNFAAVKALVSTGIQAGHMKLHARSLALLIGAKEDEVGPLVDKLVQEKSFNQEKALALLEELRANKKD